MNDPAPDRKKLRASLVSNSTGQAVVGNPISGATGLIQVEPARWPRLLSLRVRENSHEDFVSLMALMIVLLATLPARA